jgi:hypothetical protein
MKLRTRLLNDKKPCRPCTRRSLRLRLTSERIVGIPENGASGPWLPGSWNRGAGIVPLVGALHASGIHVSEISVSWERGAARHRDRCYPSSWLVNAAPLPGLLDRRQEESTRHTPGVAGGFRLTGFAICSPCSADRYWNRRNYLRCTLGQAADFHFQGKASPLANAGGSLAYVDRRKDRD